MTRYVSSATISSPSTSLTCSLTQIPVVMGVLQPIALQSKFTMTIKRTTYVNIFLQDLGINFQPNTTYSFAFSQGFVLDQANGPSPAQTLLLTTPSTGPQFVAVSADFSNQNNIRYIYVTYDRNVYNAAGTLSIYKFPDGWPQTYTPGPMNGTLKGTINTSYGIVMSQDVYFPVSGQTAHAGRTVRYEVTGDLAALTNYYITTTQGTVVDDFLLPSSAISAPIIDTYGKIPGIDQGTGPATYFNTVEEPLFDDIAANLTSSSSITINAMKYHGYVNINCQSRMIIFGGKTQYAQANLNSTSTTIAIPNNLSFQINVPTSNYTVTLSLTGWNISYWNYTVFWGDGYSATMDWPNNENNNAYTHTYSNAGIYNIVVINNIPGTFLSWTHPTGNILTKVYDWGNTYLNGSLSSTQLTNVPQYVPYRSGNYNNLFDGCYTFNDPNIKYWFTRNGTQTTAIGNVYYASSGKFTGQSLSQGAIISDNMYLDDTYANFSIEFWFYSLTSIGGSTTINVAKDINNYGQLITINNTTVNGFGITGNLIQNSWNYIVMVFDKESETSALYINGNRIGWQSESSAFGYERIYINAQGGGWLDEFKVSLIDPINNNTFINPDVKSTISVPSSAPTNDPYTLLLLHFNNSIADSSTYDGLVPGHTTMDYMMQNCQAFNQDLSGWHIPSVVSHQYFDNGANSWTLPRPPFTS